MSPLPSPVPLLVIVPCGRSKIWSKHPNAGPTPAADAYTGAPNTVNRQYAEACSIFGFISSWRSPGLLEGLQDHSHRPLPHLRRIPLL